MHDTVRRVLRGSAPQWESATRGREHQLLMARPREEGATRLVATRGELYEAAASISYLRHDTAGSVLFRGAGLEEAHRHEEGRYDARCHEGGATRHAPQGGGTTTPGAARRHRGELLFYASLVTDEV